jgi:ABC-type branched-subunit amino acid transport system substrate-binding protein
VPRGDGRRNAILAAAGIAALVLGIGYYAFVRAPGPAGSPPVANAPAPPLTFGLATALSGPSAEADRRMTMGFEAALGLVNRDGGVNGRKLRCIALDDGGEPARTPDVLENLIGTRKVFALVGSAGTPTAPAAVPWAAARKVLFFGAFTGAGLVRQEPPDRTVFTLGASWADEAAALIRHFVEARKIRPSEIVVLAPREGLGETAFSGVANALMKYGRAPEEILRVEDPEAPEAVDALRKSGRSVRAIVIAAPSGLAAMFIAKLRDNGIDAIVGVLSVARPDVLAEELRRFGPSYSTGIVGTQPVPLVDAPLPGVAVYREALAKQFPGEMPDAVSLEGFLAGRVLAEALRRAGKRPTTDSVVNALEGLRDLDLGIGAAVNFGPSEHQGLHRVWGAVLDANAGWRPLDLP